MPVAPAPNRPILPATLIGAAAQFLFTLNIARPSILMFDEVHYVPAARKLLALLGPANIEHPLLGKTLIAAGIWAFGDNQFGWRLPSTLAATAVVLGVFGILWVLFHNTRTAVFGALFTMLNFTVFIQARIGMLDGFMAAFLVLALLALLHAAYAPPGRVWRQWILGSVLLGLAVGVKWAAAPYVAWVALGFLALRWRDRGAPRHWHGLGTLPALALLGAVSVASYCLTFAPAFFYASEPMTLAGLIPFQQTMYLQQTQILPPHPYQSSWWSWPLMIRPIWYLYEPADGAQRGVLLLGNPAILWGGLIAVAWCGWTGLRTRAWTLLGIAGLWGASLLIWAIIPKSLGFFYYYYPSTIWLSLALGAAAQRWPARRKHWDDAYLAVAAVLFVYFYPIISAAALPGPPAFKYWMWLPSWA
ncbi:glycosyltransferase family 39 protein [Sphingomonas hylomeconis]|uniref:Polyprenol-phosphate-mannose--protein mannosyltransferase n=1 Tax=Sphingomonas hylomeconis TaxID=1395958 RepID=A0ABV7SZA0_9SPHN|nr:glycosyltransferase family 39 protein [Sphingomonas hylomeconis]